MSTQVVRTHPIVLEGILVHPGSQATPSATDPGLLELEELRRLCAGETEYFFRRLDHDSRFCFELFRRAIVARDQDAWECIYSQYLPLVRGWIHRHNLSGATQEEPQFLTNRVFERMWSGVTPQKFANFPDIKSLMRYLQMCVNAVLVDAVRSRERANLVDEDISSLTEPDGHERRTLENRVVRKTQAERLWALLETRCKDEKERCVLWGIFVNGLKARELYSEFQHLFADIQEVYRVKENLISRLQRDPELVQFLEKL